MLLVLWHYSSHIILAEVEFFTIFTSRWRVNHICSLLDDILQLKHLCFQLENTIDQILIRFENKNIAK